MKDGLHAGNKMNSLARSNASLYGKGQVGPGGQPGGQPGGDNDLYDRLRRHAYQGKKSGNFKFWPVKYFLFVKKEAFCTIFGSFEWGISAHQIQGFFVECNLKIWQIFLGSYFHELNTNFLVAEKCK